MTDRSPMDALLKGLRCRCPKCGIGSMFEGFLRVRDHCPHCGEALHHHRADDAPPYIVMSIVSILVIASMLYYEIEYAPAMWLHAVIFLPMTVVLSLGLLRPTKGALVGLQWANRMHGFNPNEGGRA